MRYRLRTLLIVLTLAPLLLWGTFWLWQWAMAYRPADGEIIVEEWIEESNGSGGTPRGTPMGVKNCQAQPHINPRFLPIRKAASHNSHGREPVVTVAQTPKAPTGRHTSRQLSGWSALQSAGRNQNPAATMNQAILEILFTGTASAAQDARGVRGDLPK